MAQASFASRHIGPRKSDVEAMLETVGYKSIDALIDATIPASIRLENDLDLPEGMNEQEYLDHIQEIGNKNIQAKNFIGLGYYPTIVPSV
ncbi:MAG: hypothetical protein HKN32_06765, partial [Flavobacteriales bacterium]|nr:hypothetical protein [Flavobacteriales bacterium]